MLRYLYAENLSTNENDKANLQSTIRISENIFRFLQASAILYFIHPGYLPRIEEHLEESLCRRITIVLEPCLIFVILHELGHIRFQNQRAYIDSEIDIKLEFLLDEDLNLSKAKELFADEFALMKTVEKEHANVRLLHNHHFKNSPQIAS